MKRKIFFGIASTALLIAHFSIGTPITLFLSISLIACFAYYILNLASEKNISKALHHGDAQDKIFMQFMQLLRNKRFAILSTSLLLTVFISSLYCIKKVMHPTKQDAWFLNIDHHAIRNKGIQFEKQAVFTIQNDDSILSNAGITFKKTREAFTLETENFYKPIFQEQASGKYSPINNILPQTITNAFAIENNSYALQINMVHSSNRLWYKPWKQEHITTYTVMVRCKDANILQELNLGNAYSDNFTFQDATLNKGLPLQILLQQKNTNTSIKSATQQILQNILNEIGETTLLAHYADEIKSYRVFPDENFVENNYALTVNGVTKKPNNSNTFGIASAKAFYIGLGNKNEKMLIDTLLGKTALVFDFPQAYLLSNANKATVGDKSSRFITNRLDQVINANLQEGYYFNNQELKTNSTINGTIQCTAANSANPLEYTITDNNNITKSIPANQNTFVLESNSGDLQYVFDIHNYAKNGFSYNKTLGYCIYLFLLFVAVLIFARGAKLERVEPIIWVTIYCLLVLRFILYWRVATFPPLANISKYELENTLIGFDFNFLKMQLPIPLTLLFVTLVVLGIILVRKNILNKIAFAISTKTNLLCDKLLARFQYNEVQIINAKYIAFLGICLAAFICMPWEITKRLNSILLPLLGYCYASIKAGEKHAMPKVQLQENANALVKYGKAFLHYLIHNPTFYVTLATILFFAIADRGFCIVFILFILLKNVLLNFSKKTYNPEKESLFAMLASPKNYWIYAVLSLIIYFITLSFKSLFYYALTYKLLVVGFALLFAFALIKIFYSHQQNLLKGIGLVCILYFLSIAIPTSRNFLDKQITNKIKHVQYRASIIHQPISELLAGNAFSSFNTQKIIETAENQWFINNYINQKMDRNAPINLRAFTKVGVNYNTQTRDVVLARFIIGEFGGYSMLLILCLFIMPLLMYLLSYKVRNSEAGTIFNSESYRGLIPLLFLFTISLFVWLTSTNRFVFFGQDFPFLSLTSRLSVLLPMLLFSIVLVCKPKTYDALSLNLGLGISRYIALAIAIGIFSYTTFKNNNLQESNFSVVVKSTQNKIDNTFNAILNNIQDSLQQNRIKYNYSKLCKIVQANNSYQQFKNDGGNDTYTNSVLSAWEQNEGTAMLVNNPLYMRYDRGKYIAQYNKTLYLAQPVSENKNAWHGKILGQAFDKSEKIQFTYNQNTTNVLLPHVVNDGSLSGIDMAILPADWFANNTQAIGLINVQNQYRNKVNILVQKASEQNQKLTASTFVNTINSNDKIFVQTADKKFDILFTEAKQIYASHKWVNNEYRSIYPLKEKYFYPYNFSNTIRSAFMGEPTANTTLTLDFQLVNTVQQQINATYSLSEKRNRQFAFSVIAADGNGNICLMNDFVKNRKVIDPNDKGSIYRLQEKHFFFSNTKNERDQWGNANLLNLHLGPGSSIKPLIVATVASQVNAGWQNLKYIPAAKADKQNYAGLALAQPWADDEHHFGGAMDIPTYLQHSSNFFHSVIMFLGSYGRSSFGDSNLSIQNILKAPSSALNTFPILQMNGTNYVLPAYNKGKNNWPASDASKTIKSYFANENSILANGLSINANLSTNDKDKLDNSPSSTRPTYFVDSTLHNKLLSKNTSQYLWSFPEASLFSQKMRHFISSKKRNEINENFNLGLKATTLGGYPYQITPYKMLEMYNALFTFNKNYEMHITPKPISNAAWSVDSSWQLANFKSFLATNVFEGMKRVITDGTAKNLKGVASKFPAYYFYAKTGTINEASGSQANSRRLIVTITNKDMTIAENIGNAKVYSYYFVIDNNKDFDWSLIQNIISTGMQSASFQKYFSL
jgi:hypothetical protein